MRAINVQLSVSLESFQTRDLIKIAREAGVGFIADRQDCIRALMSESPSLVQSAIDKVVSSGTIGQEEEHEPQAGAGARGKGGSSEEAMALIAKMREGVGRFAEDVDARLGRMEESVKRVLEGEPLRIRVETAPMGAPEGSAKVAFEGVAHKEFETLLLMAQAKVNILMVGPAGSGKTTAAEMLARSLGLEFRFNGAIDTEYKLKGFVDAQGRVIHTAFRDAFENGGVYLFDEVDASMPAATMAFNAALANGWCDFPDGRVTRHPNTVIIAAANTYLGGATFEYVGRNKQDAAFIDRFVALQWDIDEALETSLCSDKRWCAHVQRLRANARAKSLKVIISPRASIEGAKLLSKGLPWEFVEKAAIKKGMTDDQWAAIQK